MRQSSPLLARRWCISIGQIEGYLTVAGPGEAQLEVKRSRFLGRVERVGSDSAARAVLDNARRRHWDARHHCSAFVLGPGTETQRTNDDGEPTGTAGAPILSAILQAGVSDVVVVVTRWFGGTLLGSGELARAYGETARTALLGAGTRRRIRASRLEVTIDHAEAGRLETELRAAGRHVVGARYEDVEVRLVLEIPIAQVDAMIAELSSRTAGRARVRAGASSWVDG